MTAHPSRALRIVNEDTDVVDLPAENYLISALIESGRYQLAEHGISPDFFIANRQVNAFCCEYAARSGQAPPLHLVMERFPSFRFVPGLSPEWAAKELRDEHQVRTYTRATMKAGMHLRDGNISAVRQVWSEVLASTAGQTGKWEVRDAWEPVVREQGRGIPLMPGTLDDLTGGIQLGHLWYVAGAAKAGKTYRLADHAVTAAMSGVDVDFFSLEMGAEEISERIQRIAAMAGADPSGCGAIRVYKAATACADDIAAATSPGRLVIVDYVGLMHSNTGDASVSSWNAAAATSQQLKALASTGVAVLSAVQLSRRAFDAEVVTMDMVADTVGHVRNADVLYSLQQYAPGVQRNTILANRHGEGGAVFYTRFTPDSTRATEISVAEAMESKFDAAMEFIDR